MESVDFTLHPYFWRATNLFPEKEIVTLTPTGTHRYTYSAFGERVGALANALDELGVGEGDRVGTFCWNHYRHFEAYFAVPLMGAQLHTINVQLPDEHVEFIVDDAGDDVLLVDPGGPFDTIERLREGGRLDSVDRIVVVDDTVPETDLDVLAYEPLLDGRERGYEWPALTGNQPAGMCYTSGTTGRPKGVEYSHEMLYAHALMATTPSAIDISERDVVMPVVPMYHVNAWEFPYSATLAGATQVYPGPSPDTADLARLIESENVTIAAGVPTVWIDLLEHLDGRDDDLASLERILSGGSAVPAEVMRRYDEEYDVRVDHAWGMTETMSVGSCAHPRAAMDDWPPERRRAIRRKQGLLSPGLEMCVVDDDSEEVPWDGESVGELYVRGPTVVPDYYGRPQANAEEFVMVPTGGTADDSSSGQWLRTGDIVTVDEYGYIEIVDRAKDVIKSGGEWISSIELENAIMAHDAVSEAVVVGLAHEKWQERPFAAVVTKPSATLSAEELRDFLGESYPRWWLPDGITFVETVPKTATGKFDKKVVRDRYENANLPWTPGE
jgi:fatty-acyl-CoA synthase